MSELQVEAEREYDYVSKRECVRIKYRERGTRRWTRFIAFPSDGMTIGDVMNRRREFAEFHQARRRVLFDA